MQTQTSCNLILLTSLCYNLRLGAIYAVTSSFDISRSHGAGGGHSDRILSLCVSVTFSFSIRRFWGKGRRDCEKERERRDRKYITVSLFPPPLKSQISPSPQGSPGYPGYVTLYIGGRLRPEVQPLPLYKLYISTIFSRNHVTDLSTESGNLFKMAAKIKSERIWVRGLQPRPQGLLDG